MSRAFGSPYIEWAKLESSASYNLAASGVMPLSLAELGATAADVEIAGTSLYGYDPLVDRIAASHRVPRSSVVLAPGTSMANHLVMAALLDPGDEVLVERPTYEPLLSTAAYFGASIRRVDRRPEADFTLDADMVARGITSRTRLVVLANLHNPSSQLTDVETLDRIGSAASGVGARVLVDEVYRDAVFDETPPSACHLGPAFVATGSLTKVYGLSGLRCGWILCEPALAHRIWRLKDLFDNVPAVPAERLSVVAFDRLIGIRARARALLDANRRVLEAFLASRDDLDARTPAYGTTACARPRACSADALCRLLRERYDTSVVPGRFFELPDYFRIGICGETPALVEGLARLGRALDELGGR